MQGALGITPDEDFHSGGLMLVGWFGGYFDHSNLFDRTSGYRATCSRGTNPRLSAPTERIEYQFVHIADIEAWPSNLAHHVRNADCLASGGTGKASMAA